MIGMRADRATQDSEAGEFDELPLHPVEDGGARRPPTAGRLLLRLVQVAFGAVLVWVAAVLLLGLSYLLLPPISTLMLARLVTLRPVERTVVSLEEVSPHLPLAVMSAEDARLCQHAGVDWDMLREVVEAADEDGPVRGASTIPMQVAKNLFLWPSRSYIRKGLELPIALYIDLIWSKRRMMEVYLNVAEWGEGTFGAEAAAQRYFRKPARDLTRREAALLATALPNPFRRNPARPSGRHRALADRLLGRMEGTAPFAGCLKL
ncbi:MAG TPA: monofunctional biosynthetic peptidoglycan transglycosylase [Microvirga sp.]|nr:monofunctional biosynthetic peptidoglycan transglycosylase [Microvirga sp.]